MMAKAVPLISRSIAPGYLAIFLELPDPGRGFDVGLRLAGGDVLRERRDRHRRGCDEVTMPASPIFPFALTPSQRAVIIEAVRVAEQRMRQLAQAE